MTRSEQARLDDIATKVEARHEEHLRRFDNQDQQLRQIATDVKSLLATRSFTRGMLRAVAVVSGAISTIVGLVIAYLTARS